MTSLPIPHVSHTPPSPSPHPLSLCLQHELVVAAEAGGAAVHTIVQVRVADVNDNAPYFLHPEPFFTVIEEDDRDLPSSITTVSVPCIGLRFSLHSQRRLKLCDPVL